MIEEIGTVVGVEGEHAWIETKVKTTCGSCVANDNCGTGLVAKAFTPKPEYLKIPTPHPLSVGQTVKIGIAEQHLLRASAWMYLVPVLALVLSAAALQTLTNLAEPLVILLSFCATFLSYWWVSRSLKTMSARKEYMPVFLGATHEAGPSRKSEILSKKL
ncbi:SoxR reducing system RseC family protein [Glaciecola siphonariae]|uniref:SoxR reducing system RseC family protein n=1 Tax=Glaciecola siphonariae TaxID=521012 RepID=A0ABV9M0D5_9ALTE